MTRREPAVRRLEAVVPDRFVLLMPPEAVGFHHRIAGRGAIYPCPDPGRCPCTTAEERIGLCPPCEPEEGVEILSRSEDGFEAIIRSLPKNRIRVQ